ncbi:MAG: ferritin-like domain-containing protein [Polyangiaceae bacterium]|nr:ferritin-like domain-containing protein [Polyangiaceae bacterium]
MPRANPLTSGSALSQLFASSLAVAAAACSSDPSTPPETPRDSGPVHIRVRPDPALVAYAAEFKGASLGEALPQGYEIVAFVDAEEELKCTPEPCKPEWKAHVPDGWQRAVVVKKGEEELVLRAHELGPIIEDVDTPAKAALVARLQLSKAATCADFAANELACAEGSTPESIPVRTKDGFEVATFGPQNVCMGNEQSDRNVFGLGVVSVSFDHKVNRAGGPLNEEVTRGAMQLVRCYYPSRGRMFAGYVDLPPEQTELEYYVRAHRQEAAAVVAFERLAAELDQHGAPDSLVAAARNAADEERRHAAMFRCEAEALAAVLGMNIDLDADCPTELPVRSLLDVLVENASEGCVNETYAAVVATHQAAHAPTPRLRATLQSIAAEEQGHAALAHRIHQWGISTLSTNEAASIDRALEGARDNLRCRMAATEQGLALGEPEPELAVLAFEHVSAAFRGHAATANMLAL